MAQKLSKSDLPQLLPWLEKHQPNSFKLHGELKGHLNGKFPDLDFFVDKWPNPQAALALVHRDDKKYERRVFLEDKVVAVFAVSDESLAALLKDPNVFDWEFFKLFVGVPSCIWPALEKVADEMGKSLNYWADYLLKATPEVLKPVPIPEGMKISSITDDEVGVVDSTWRFQAEGTEAFLRDLIHFQPSVFMTTEDGQHVGHMMGESCGSMGMLYINPEFRRKGYAKVVISQLAKCYFDQGEDVYVLIVDDNPTSLSLHQSLGFEVVPDMKIGFFSIHPKK